MLRLLFLLSFLFWPVTSSTDFGARDPLTARHNAAFADAERMRPLVEKRFALYAEMERCHHTDDQYAYNLALEKFAPSERFILHQAADIGWQAGATQAAREDGSCEAAIDRLRAADDALLTQAELLHPR